MHIIALLNEKAGATAPAGADSPQPPDRIRELCAQCGWVTDLRHGPPEQLVADLRHALAAASPPSAVIVAGGDGTVSCAAALLAGSDIPLGVVPTGTLNHFAKDIGLPPEPEACLQMIAAGHTRTVDVAEVNGRVFINNCSIGVYPAAVQRRDALRAQRGHGKWRAMIAASCEVFRDLRRLHVEITVDGRVHARRTPFVLVSNNLYSGALFSRSLRERMDAGEIWAYTTRAHRFFPLLRLAWGALTRGIDGVDHLERHAARELIVNLRERKPRVALDGEVVALESPLRFVCRPQALRVFVPPKRPVSG